MLSGATSGAVEGEVPSEQSALSGAASMVFAKQGEVAPPIASEVAGGEVGLLGTQRTIELAEDLQ